MPAPVVLAAFGALLVSLDASLNIALPAVAAAFGIGPGRGALDDHLLRGHVCPDGLGGGILADRLGALRVFTAGLWLSAVVFAAYWLAPSYAATLACRVAQGVSGGLIYGTASALVTQSLPRERHGRGLGVMSLGLGVGVAVGPVIGGLLVDGFGWRAVFLYRAPLALALAVVAARFLGRSLRGAPRMLRRLALADIARLAVLRPAVLAFLATFAQFSVWLLIPFYLVSARAIGASLGACSSPCPRSARRWPRRSRAGPPTASARDGRSSSGSASR